MKYLCVLFASIVSYAISYSQSICQTGDEGSTVTLTAPAGKVFLSVTFASYGTPNGSCGSFTIGGCHAANSQSIVETALLGKNSGSIAANNTVFGDPCGGTFKRLYVEAVYGFPLPLKLVSFSGEAGSSGNVLKWSTENEVNTSEIVLERSTDGSRFNKVGLVKTNNNDKNDYSFTDIAFSAALNYYRLKMVDADGRYEYSNVISIKRIDSKGMQLYPNPVIENLTIKGLTRGAHITIINSNGIALTLLEANNEMINVDFSSYAAGVYFVKYYSNQKTVTQRIVKF